MDLHRGEGWLYFLGRKHEDDQIALPGVRMCVCEDKLCAHVSRQTRSLHKPQTAAHRRDGGQCM